LRVVFDTNVLAAASLSNRGASFALISMLPSPKFELAVSSSLYFEYLDVMLRPDVRPPGLTDAEIVEVVDEITSAVHYQNIFFRWRPWLKDEKDDMVLELAIASQSSYIVTFNLKDFRNIEFFGIGAVTPKDFLELVRSL
jgi:putative PIN family toxin of toxin-antitoxin system